MIFIAIGLILLAGAAVLGISGAKVGRKNGSRDTYVVASAEEGAVECDKEKESKDNSTSTTEAQIDTTKYLTRAEVEKLLRVLAESPPPKDIRPAGALCYAMLTPPDAIYVCPECGEKTIYSSFMASFVRTIPGCRRMVKTIVQVPIMLDESQFCKKCSPEIESPELCLHLRYKGEETHHEVCRIHSTDLSLLSEFLSGKDRHRDQFGDESALQSHLNRLEEILNIELESGSTGQEEGSEDER